MIKKDFNQFNYKFGERIAEIRRNKGLSQEELSLISKINKNYISGIETGERNPSMKLVKQIADALNITLEELFKGF